MNMQRDWQADTVSDWLRLLATPQILFIIFSQHLDLSQRWIWCLDTPFQWYLSASGDVLSVILKPFRIAPLIGQKHYENCLTDWRTVCRCHMSLKVSIIWFFLFFLHLPIRNTTVVYISVILCGGTLLPHIFSTQLYRNNEMLCHFNNTFPRNNETVYS